VWPWPGVFMLVGVLVVGAGFLLVVLSRTSGSGMIPAFLLWAAVFGLLVTFAVRLVRVGVYANDRQVWIRNVFRSEKIEWNAVRGVRSTSGTRVSSSLIRSIRLVCMDIDDGRTIELPIMGMSPGVGRAFRLPDVLSGDEYDQVLGFLRDSVSRFQAR